MEDIKKAKDEAQKENHEEAELQRELDQEQGYQELLMKYKFEFQLINESDYEEWKKNNKKK